MQPAEPVHDLPTTVISPSPAYANSDPPTPLRCVVNAETQNLISNYRA